jgi:uncharacterized membrane protein
MLRISKLLIAAIISLVFNSNTAVAVEKSARRVNSCFGTEPFWDLEITSKFVKFQDADKVNVMTIPKAPPAAAEGTNEDYIAIYQGRTAENSNKFMNVIIVGDAACSDDMSERKYPFSAFVLSGKTLYKGCCK